MSPSSAPSRGTFITAFLPGAAILIVRMARPTIRPCETGARPCVMRHGPPLGVLLFASAQDEPTGPATDRHRPRRRQRAAADRRVDRGAHRRQPRRGLLGDLLAALPGSARPDLAGAVLGAGRVGGHAARRRRSSGGASLSPATSSPARCSPLGDRRRRRCHRRPTARGTSSTLFADADGPPSYPPGALTLSAAVISTASPHVSRPFRHFGRWLVVGPGAGARCCSARRR